MKIAAPGDIHGDIEALKAAYGAAVREGVDKIYHPGDLGGYAPDVNEVVDFLIGHGVEGVQGNKVPYDIGKTVDAILNSGLPTYFAERLKEGG